MNQITLAGFPGFLCAPARERIAFDLLELDGADMRREPIEVRKATLASILRKSRHGLRFNEHFEHPDGLACSTRMPEGPGADRVQADGTALPFRPVAGLAKVQEPGGAGAQAEEEGAVKEGLRFLRAAADVRIRLV